MKRLIIISILCFLSVFAKGQVYQLMPQYGYDAKRMNFDSTLSIPSFCGAPSLLSNKTKKAAIAFDSCNNRFYYYNPKLFTWDTIRTGTTVDTTNRFVNAVVKINDSTFRVYKGSTSTDISIGLVTSATRLITEVWNNTGSTITRGSVVYISGRHSSNLPTIAVAEANNEENSYKTFALVSEDISDNSRGYVIQAGKISGLNLPTSSYTDGDILYLSPTVPGGYTTTKPLAPYHIVKLGSVTRAHPTQGSIEIKIENGWQLDELSDVQIPAVPNDSALLQYSRVDSLWHSVSPSTAIGNRYIKPSDTTAMLSPYIRSNTADTTFATSVFRKTASDSVFFVRGGSNVFAFRDSLGGGSAANPTASVGLTAVNGSAATFMRSDAAPALSQSISPTWTGLHTFNNGMRFSNVASNISWGTTLVTGGNNILLYDGNTASTRYGIGVTSGNLSIFGYSGSTIRLGTGVDASSSTGYSLSIGSSSAILSSGVPLITSSTAGTNGILFFNGGSPSFRMGIGNTSGSQLGIFTYSNKNILFGQGRDASNLTESNSIMWLDGTNNSLIIGNSINAGYKLDVNGTARVQGALTATGIATIGGYIDYGNTIFTGRSSQLVTGGGSSSLGLRANGNIEIAPNASTKIATFTSTGLKVGDWSTPVASAIVEVSSTTQGFLPPRMTTTQRDAISSPAAGLIIYNSTTNKHQGYNGTTWNDFY